MSQHRWSFTRLGGFTQARMETADDFAHLHELDQKLWAALACPVKGLAFDTRTLALLDHDDDGRIRAPEVIEAARWCTASLKTLDALAQGGQPVALGNINTSHDEGAGLLASARNILHELGKADSPTLSVDDAALAADRLAKAARNGDGVVPAAAVDDEDLKSLVGEIVGALGGVADRGGEAGVDQATLDTFFADAQAVVDWTDAADETTRPLGDNTAAAADAVKAVQAKVDDFFARCRLAAFDERALVALNRREEEYLEIAARDLSVTAEEIAGFPLAQVQAGRPLPLVDALNPAWADRIGALRSAAVEPLLGTMDVLTEDAWKQLQARLAPFEAWRGARPTTAVLALGAERLRVVLASDAKDRIASLIAADAAVAPQVASVAQVERLVRYHRDLYDLARNFVNFTDFYSDERRATFEAGTLYLDGRACELVVRVDDAAKHGVLAARSKLYLAYCACTRPSGEKLDIAAAFTDGDADLLMVGRNGVFYDRDGKDWDATITKVVENPISLRQAFWSPYKQVVRWFEDMAAKRAEAREAEAAKQRDASLQQTAGKPGEAPKPPTVDLGTVAAIAVGLGALGSMLVALIGYVTGLFTLPFWIICLVVLAVFIAISMPSVMVAWLKLRQRSLGPVLDANGWAINGRAGVSVRFGHTMTHVAHLPRGARITARDKYADPVNPWPRLLLVLVVLGFIYSLLNTFGVIHSLSGGRLGDAEGATDLWGAVQAEQDITDDTDAAPAP